MHLPKHISWKDILHSWHTAVMIVSPEGRIQEVNQQFERLLGMDRSQLLGRSCTVLKCRACAHMRSSGRRHWCRLFGSSQPVQTTCTLRDRQGDSHHVLKQAQVLYDNSNQVSGAVETFTDLSPLTDHSPAPEISPCTSHHVFQGMVGLAPGLCSVLKLLVKAAQSDAPVLIRGESGVGKDLAAKAIHRLSPRQDKPYVPVNVAALNGSLLESELFGHAKGAFTGAHTTRTGRFETADQGTLFLDEVGDIPLSVQTKLLRVLENRTIERVGENRSRPVHVRLISATNCDLCQALAQGSLRPDFFFRLNVLPITIPPLRERLQDLPLLIRHFLSEMHKEAPWIQAREVSDQGLKVLREYGWPGNIRELRSVLYSACVHCHDPVIEPEHLAPLLQPEIGQASRELGAEASRQRQELVRALQETGGNRRQTADKLGVSRVTVWSRINRFNIDVQAQLRSNQGKG